MEWNAYKNGLLIHSRELLQLPSICARCGEHTTRTVGVRVAPLTNCDASVFLSALPNAGTLATAAEHLSLPRVQIPSCGRCQLIRIRGLLYAIVWIVCGVRLLIFSFAHIDDVHPALWGVLVTAGMILALGSPIPIAYCDGKAAPAGIWRTSDGYLYNFFGGAYREWLESRKKGNANDTSGDPVV